MFMKRFCGYWGRERVKRGGGEGGGLRWSGHKEGENGL